MDWDSLHATRESIMDVLKGVRGGPIDGANVEVWGTFYPLDEVVRAAVGQDVATIPTEEALDYLTRLAFVCRTSGGTIWTVA